MMETFVECGDCGRQEPVTEPHFDPTQPHALMCPACEGYTYMPTVVLRAPGFKLWRARVINQPTKEKTMFVVRSTTIRTHENRYLAGRDRWTGCTLTSFGLAKRFSSLTSFMNFIQVLSVTEYFGDKYEIVPVVQKYTDTPGEAVKI